MDRFISSSGAHDPETPFPILAPGQQTWSITDLLYSFRGNFSGRTQWVVLSDQDSAIFPDHSAGFGSSCLFTKLAI